MMIAILFGLLGLFLTGFREGVWTKYTAQDVARWQIEAAEQAATASSYQPPAANPVVQLPSKPTISSINHAPRAEQKQLAEIEEMELEVA
jgi:hypothetical protein